MQEGDEPEEGDEEGDEGEDEGEEEEEVPVRGVLCWAVCRGRCARAGR